MSNAKVRLSLDVSSELNETLDAMAEQSHSSKSEILRKSIALMGVALQEKERGNHLSVVSSDQKIIKEIIGL
jgi:predicted transcriptional regulator